MAEDFFDFELVPADSDVLSADEALDSLIDPDDVETEQVDVVPIGKSRSIDFDTGITGPVVHGNDAVVAVAVVAIRTKRGEHPIFDDEFGMDDPDRLVGQVEDPELIAAHQRDMTETLLSCHDRITAVSGFHFLHDQDDELSFADLTIEIDGEDEERLQGIPLNA